MLTLLALIPFYLIGCFPSGILVAKLNNVDLSTTGSGNIGATNVARTIGKRAGIQTLLMDVGKGILAVCLAFIISDYLPFRSFSALAVVAGHCFSIPGKLKGGKGVATALGAIACLAPLLATICVVIFGIFFYLFKIVSLASIIAAGSVALLAMPLNYPDVISLSVTSIAVLVIYRHKENIQRLVRGEEKQFKSKD
jgi:acyl phosphate:glycerol-3-phosphate acyltransferase